MADDPPPAPVAQQQPLNPKQAAWALIVGIALTIGYFFLGLSMGAVMTVAGITLAFVAVQLFYPRLFRMWAAGFFAGLPVGYALGLNFAGIIMVCAVLIVLLSVDVFWPKGFKTVLRYVIVDGVIPFGIFLLLAVHWFAFFMALILFPIIVLSENRKQGFILIIILIVGLVLIRTFTPFLDPGSPLGQAWLEGKEAGVEAIEYLYAAPGYVEEGVKRQLCQATRTCVKTKVDENEKKILGIDLKDFKADSVPSGATFRASATIVGSTLDLPIAVNYACSVDGVAPTRYLNDRSVIEFPINSQKLERPVSCTYDAGTLADGRHRINFTMDYEFVTYSYSEGSFILEETLANLLAEGIDIYKDPEWKVTKDPVARGPTSPVELGIAAAGSQPVIVNENDDHEFELNIEFKKQSFIDKDSFIRRLHSLIMYLPKSFEVTRVFVPTLGDVEFSEASCLDLNTKLQEGCDDELFSLYVLHGEDIPKQSIFAQSEAVNLVAEVTFPGAAQETILGNIGFGEVLYSAVAEYSFGTVEQKYFTVGVNT
ncbi:hypothetical protein GF342_04135 [Candidatus Woesearchaeota archaeon]|nr:hypothetical protein [Candidatus Woesearchaeota archaeon]